MCGRYTQVRSWRELVDLYKITETATPLNLAARYNIAPTQDVPVVRNGPDGRGRELVSLRWGLVPSWAKDIDIASRLINARAETVAEKPSFRDAYKQRRCLIPADGFYEWQKQSQGPKQPYYITSADGGPLTFAGLWERWEKAADGRPVETCTIITTEANERLKPIHHRLPVVLIADSHDAWLGVEGQRNVAALLEPVSSGALEAIPVSTHVNNTRNDDPRCVEPER